MELSLPPSTRRVDGGRASLRTSRSACATNKAALQMVTREGVVSEAELIEFRSEVETLAARIKATGSRSGDARGPRSGARTRPHLRRRRHPGRAARGRRQADPRPVGASASTPLSASARREDGVHADASTWRAPADVGRSYEAMAARRPPVWRAAPAADVWSTTTAARSTTARSPRSARSSRRCARTLLGRGIETGSPLALRLFS